MMLNNKRRRFVFFPFGDDLCKTIAVDEEFDEFTAKLSISNRKNDPNESVNQINVVFSFWMI